MHQTGALGRARTHFLQSRYIFQSIASRHFLKHCGCALMDSER